MDQEAKDYLRDQYLAFTAFIFEAVNGSPFLINWHHHKIAETMTRVLTGEITRLIINIPPRYTKTELAVVNFIPFAMGHFPDAEFIHVSYSKRLAANNAYKAREIVLSEAYQSLFPEVQLKNDSKAKDEWRTTKGGVVYATGSEGTITGYGAGKVRPHFGGAILIDDPHKANEAESDVVREGVLEWFQNTLESRVNSKHTPIIVIMQRLHQRDLAGFLLEGGNGETWDHLMIPAEDDLGNPLWPYKHDKDDLERMKNRNGYVYAGQYLQIPAPREGAMVKKHWPQRYIHAPQHPIMIVQSWDTAYKDKQINDPSVCSTWAIARNGYYLLDVFRARLDYPKLKRAVAELFDRWSPSAVLIEDKASGQSLIQELRAATLVPCIPITPDSDKLTRMSAESAQFEGGLVYLPYEAPWLPEYESELFVFPRSSEDDQVDSTSQFLRWARESSGQFESVVGTGRRDSIGEGLDIDEDTGFGRVRSANNFGGF